MYLDGVCFKMNIESEKKVTFNDLLKMPVVEVENIIHYRCFYYWKFFDDELELSSDENAIVIKEDRVKTKFIKNHCFDGRRTWELGYITFDDQPVMFFYAYGRDGLDGYGKAMINDHLYRDLIQYMKSLKDNEDFESDHIYDLDDDATWCTNFYGQSLFEEFK